jgi:solute carrier family 25 oxoglutarate transporter 11
LKIYLKKLVFLFHRSILYLTTMLKPKYVDGRPSWFKNIQPFAFGGVSGAIASTCIAPIDFVKVKGTSFYIYPIAQVQIQLIGEKTAGGATASTNPFSIAANVYRTQGLLAFYRGVDAGILRQLTYTTTRIGLFRYIGEQIKSKNEKTLPIWKKSISSLTAGAIAAFVGNPFDLSLVRMQTDHNLPEAQRMHYRNVLHTLSCIVKHEGLFSLWKGVSPTVGRACAINTGQMVTFDQARENFDMYFGKGWTSTLSASALSGLFAAAFSLPFDFVKTRMQKQKPDPVTGILPYKGFFNCVSKIARKEGVGAFFVGFPTYYFRVAPQAMITLIVMDFFDNMAMNFFKKPVPRAAAEAVKREIKKM